MERVDLDAVWDAGLDMAEELVSSGVEEDKAVKAVATFLDKIVPLDALIPGPVGVIAEELDGAAFERVVKAISDLFKVDPEKRAERKANRQVRAEARRIKKAEAKANRRRTKGDALSEANPRR